MRFSHKGHVIDKHLKCSQCHPRPHEMVKQGSSFDKIKELGKRTARDHDCAKCDNRTDAFLPTSNCKRCHGGRHGSGLRSLCCAWKPCSANFLAR